MLEAKLNEAVMLKRLLDCMVFYLLSPERVADVASGSHQGACPGRRVQM